MRRSIYKFFASWEHEKEEQWLDGLSSRGLQLVDVGLCRYVVDDSPSERFTYRIEYMKHAPTSAEGTAYIRFLEESGVEHVGTLLNWAYFRKRTSEGPFEIYSDLGSKIAHQRRISVLLWTIGSFNAAVGFSSLASAISHSIPSLSLVNWALALVLFFGAFRVERKIHVLKKESRIHE